MKPHVAIIGIVLNTLLVAGIIYFTYYAPRNGRTGKGEQTRLGPEKKIALIVPTQSRTTITAIIDGITDSLNSCARFAPDIKIYNANDNRALMRSNIDAAINQQADVLVALGSQAAQMTKEITEKREARIPTVFAATGDPLRLELINDPACSGNHLTGVSIIGLDWIEQMADLIPVVMPWVKKVLIPYDPTGFGGALEEYVARYTKALERHNLEVITTKVYATNEVGSKVAPFVEGIDLMIVLPDAVVVDAIDLLNKLSYQHGFATYAALNMGLLSRGVSFAFGYYTYDIGVAATGIIRQIIEHQRPPTAIAIDQMADTFRIGMNEDNARKQGVLAKMDKSTVFMMANGEVI